MTLKYFLISDTKIKQTSGDYTSKRFGDQFLPKKNNGGYENFDDAINHFVKTSEYNEYKPWFKDDSLASNGFYLMDYIRYCSILNEVKDKDDDFRKNKINQFKESKPILFNTKKFKRTIGNELENRKILNPELLLKVRQQLENEATFIDLSVMDQMETITGELEKDWLANNSGYSIFNPEFYIKYNNIIPEQFIFKLTNEKNRFKSYGEKEEKKKEKNIFDFIESNQNLNEVAKVNVSNNKLILFNNNSLTTKNPKNYEEKFVECNNGIISIYKIFDSIHEENIQKGNNFHKELVKNKWLLELLPKNTSVNSYEKILKKITNLYLSKYKIKEPGNCYYYANLK